MTRYILSIISVLLLAPLAQAANEISLQRDTLYHTTNASQVVITESSNGVQFHIKTNDSDTTSYTFTQEYAANGTVKSHQDTDRTFYKSNPDKWDLTCGGLGLGMVSAPNSGVDIEPTKSFEISLFRILAVKYTIPGTNNNFTLGVGVDWRNYRTTTGLRFIDNNGTVTTGAYPDDSTPRYSRLKTFSLQFPLMYEQYLPITGIGKQKVTLSLGAIGCWNSHASILSTWTNSGNVNIEEYSGSINHRKFTVDYMAIVKFIPYTGLYVRYSPSSVLTGAISPKFSSLSFGILLGI